MAFLSIGQMWATDYELVYTLDGTNTSCGGSSAYDAAGNDVVQSDIHWAVVGNVTQNPWRIGGKSLSGVNRTVTSMTAISDDIAKIEIEHGTQTLSAVNSMTVEVASNSNFSTIVSSFNPTYEASKTVTILRPEGKDWSNCFYRITYNVNAGKSNSYLQLVSVKMYTEQAAPAFSITAQSNDESKGTVLLSGTVITGSPKSGCRYASPAYTVTSGTATVAQSGNAFTVTPSSDCTVRINFEAIPHYTVTWDNNGSTSTSQVLEGNKPVFPATPDACDATSTTFIGWATEAWSGKLATPSVTVYTSASAMPAVSAAVTYYAVFAKAGGSASNLFTWAGGTKSELAATEGVEALTADNSDYAAGNAPYRVKWNTDGMYIIISVASQPGQVSAGFKMLGGASTSTITVQEADDAEGPFTDVEVFTISGATNDVVNRETSSSFKSTTRAIKLLYHKGSNVGLGPISIKGAVSYEDYMTTCTTPTVVKPTISGETSFWSSTEVTLAQAEADAIYYTTNGDDPTINNDFLYSAPFTLTNSATVKAIAVKGGVSSAVAEETFSKIEAKTTMAEVQAATTSTTDQSINVTISNWVVTAVSGSQVWFTDADNTKGILLYKSGHGFTVGKKLNGNVLGTKVKLYNLYPELTSLLASEVTVTDAEAVIPRTTSIDALLSGHPAEQGTVVKLEGVTYESAALSDGVNSIAADNKFFSSLALVEGTTYDITGVITYYKNGDDAVVKIAPRSIDDVEAKSAVVTPTAANLAALKAADRGTYILTLENAVVTYVNGKNALIEDATGGALIFIDGHGFTAGNCLNGDYQVTTTDYQGKFEITAIEPQAGAATTTAEIPLTTVTIATLNAAFSSYESRRVKIVGANVTDAISGDDRNGAINDGAAVAVYAAAGKNVITLTADDNVDIIGYPGFHNTDQQLNVWRQEDITVNSTPTPPASDYTMSFDLTRASYDDAADAEVVWNSNVVTMTADKNDGTKVTNYLAGNYSGTTLIEETRFYAKNSISFVPQAGVTITKIEWMSTAKGYATKLAAETFVNATAVVDGTDDKLVIITPSAAGEISVTLTDAARATGVTVYYQAESEKAPLTASIAIDNISMETSDPDILLTDIEATSNPNKKAISYAITSGTAVSIVGEGKDAAFHALEEGTATITATIPDDLGNYTGATTTFNIEVSAPSKFDPALAYTPNELEIEAADIASWSAPVLGYATGFDGLADIEYASDNESVATVEGGVIALVGGYGTAVITATFGGNTNYLAGSATYTITVNAPAPTPTGTTYTKVTSTGEITDGEYLIVYEAESVAFNGDLTTLDAANNTVSVVISGDEIAGTTAIDAAVFTIDVANGTLRAHMGDYIGVTSYGNGLKQNANAETYPAHSFSIDGDGNAVISLNDSWTAAMILNYNKGVSDKRFRYYKSASPQQSIQLYKKDTPEPPTPVVIRDGLENGKWGTICPKQTVENATGATFYQISYLEEQNGLPFNMVFDPITGTTLTAGQPYFFIAEGTEITGIKVGAEVSVASAGVNGFYGYIGDGDKALSWKTDYVAGEDNTFVIYGNTVMRLNAATNLKSERCYININATEPTRVDPTPGAAPRRRVVVGVSGTNVATGIDALNASETPVKMIIDGQLFIIRGEKMYNVNGQVVK